MPGVIRKLWRFAAGLFAVVVILLAVFVGLLRLALVQVPEYREQIQSWAGQALGWPVEVGEMDARLGLRGPELDFSDGRVLSRDGRHTLAVAAVGGIRLDPWSLLRGRPRVALLRLSGVSLRVEHGETGRWRLLGDQGPALGDGGAAVPRLAELPPVSVLLEDLHLEFEDQRRAMEPWHFQVDSLQLQLADGRLEISADGVLPEALGSALSFAVRIDGQDARGRPADWHASVTAAALDLRAIGEALGRPEWAPSTGTAAGFLEVQSVGTRVQRVTGHVRTRQLSLPEPPDADGAAPISPYRRLDADLEWTRSTDGWRARVTELDVQREDRRWRSPGIVVDFAADQAGRSVTVDADLLRLEDLLPISPWLPAGVRAVVDVLAPTGTLREFKARLELPDDEAVPPDVQITTSFEGLSIRAGPRSPGVRHLSGRVTGDGRSGSAQLGGAGLALEFPWLFREPLVLDASTAELTWRQDDTGLRLSLPEIAAGNADLAVLGRAELGIPADGSSPQLEMAAIVRDIEFAAGPRYLPVGIMPERVVEWLDRALQGGRVAQAHVEFAGPTRKFPFRDGDGLFRASFEMTDGTLEFAPGWPAATGIAAAVRFENEGLWAEVREARIHGIEGGPVSAAIPDLARGRLEIQGTARGSLAEFREFVLATELLEKILGTGIRPAAIGAGRATADVDLVLPLSAIKDHRAQVELQVAGGMVEFPFLGEPLRDVHASIRIDNAQVTASGATATLAGQPWTADVSVVEEGAIRIDARGPADAPGLGRVLRQPLEAWADGTSDWEVSLQFPAAGSVAPLALEVRSRLEGMAIDLPEPFRKSAQATRGLRVRAEFPASGLVDAELEWQGSLKMAARLDRSTPEPRLLVVPGAAPGALPGILISGSTERLDLGQWLEVKIPAGVEVEGLAGVIGGGRLLVGQLTAPGLRVNDLLLEAWRAADRWVLELAGDRLAGRLEIPYALRGAEPVVARLDRLWLGVASDEPAPPTDRPPEEPRLERRVHPASIPPLDLEIDDVRFNGIRFGSISARVLHEGDGIELIGLEGIGERFMFQAEGRSRLSDTVDESRLSLRVRSEDVGATLGFMGFRRSMEASHGRFDAEVAWRGGLRSDWLAVIEGEASIAIGEGSLVGVEPGAGRVFGLLSIEAIPRRLALDFKDVFGEGMAFDRISGDFRFAGGGAYTENLVMRGPAVDIGVVGRTGLVARDYDQTAVIGADLGRTLPVAGAVVGGPAVGAALFLLSQMLRKPFRSQITYRLTGSWDNPVIEKVSSSAPARSGASSGEPEPEPEAIPGEHEG